MNRNQSLKKLINVEINKDSNQKLYQQNIDIQKQKQTT